ncbi:acetolactate synthase catalytic subunit [Faunimonas sp. B44]|uniref:acetolactate synthase catalytic subunit n=1 Tax=Faunimonas sp. B44 TaxID=3461493 RepID=UPI0040442409
MSNEQTVAQAIASALARHGVEVIFSQSLPSAVLLAAEDLGLQQYVYRTENAGAAMADGFARISGRAAVVTAQNGPAATLLVPGLAEALKSSIPVVALVQDVNRDQMDRNAFQDLDHFALFGSCAKWIRRLTVPSRTEDYVDMAFAAATGGRPGPAVLLLPADVLLERASGAAPRGADLGRFPLDRTVPPKERIEEAAALIASAKRPLIFAGGGVHISGAAGELAVLQEKAQIPVATTVMGKGAVDERHPLSLGVGGNALGRLSPSRHFAERIRSADVVLLVGTRTAQNGTDSWTSFAPDARFIHIDMDPSEIGRNYEALRLVGDAKLTLAALGEAIRGPAASAGSDRALVRAGHERHEAEIAALAGSEASPIRPERLMRDMQTVLTPDTIVVADASYSTIWVASYLTSLAPGMRFITPRGIAGLGWGLPLAMGARRARPESPVLSVVGDGGFAHVWSELETCRRTGTSVIVTVLNNGVLGYQKDAEDMKFGRHTSACYFEPVDHAAIAEACGCRGVRIERAADYLPALKEALAAGGTFVLDIVTDPEAYPPITFFDKLDGFRETRSR